MKQLMTFISTLFRKNKIPSSLFSEAISEGIRDMFKEAGYKANNDSIKKKGGER